MQSEGEYLYYIILASFLMPLALSAGLIWFFVSYQKRKTEYQISLKDEELKQQALIIEKQNALTTERTRIASEMHDDLGGGLTTIKFLSQKILRKTTDEPTKKQVKKIVNQSETLVNNMSEIIWAMNAGFDTLSSLISYSRRYAHTFLEDHGIDLKFRVDGKTTNIKLTGTERRNIFLVIKEVLHNTVKHSQATLLEIDFSLDEEGMAIAIKDNGRGITTEDILGNGLSNMKARMEKIGGTYSHKNESGLRTIITFPFRTF